jgi:putative transposase
LLSLDVCIEAVEEALARYGKPDIFNTDLGSQFIFIPLNVRGAWRDNVFVERL